MTPPADARAADAAGGPRAWAGGAGGSGAGPDHPPDPVVRESAVASDPPLYAHPEWADRFPWAFAATTGRGNAAEPFDLGLFGATPVGTSMRRWRAVARAAGCARTAHARQVHGARLLRHAEGAPGFLVSDGYDGHLTREPGVLLAVSIADCVPVFLLSRRGRAVALLHAGWRGVAAGVLERGVAALCEMAGAEPAELSVHLGPAICGACYEVGPEVHEALGLRPPDRNTPIDLRAVLAGRALSLGVPRAEVTRSSWCTRCGDSPFFSHRGGDAERQMALLAIRP